MIGFFGYDLAPRLERLPRRHSRDSRLPDIRMALYDTAVIVDDRSGTAELWSWDLTGEGRSAARRRAEPGVRRSSAQSGRRGRLEFARRRLKA